MHAHTPPGRRDPRSLGVRIYRENLLISSCLDPDSYILPTHAHTHRGPPPLGSVKPVTYRVLLAPKDRPRRGHDGETGRVPHSPLPPRGRREMGPRTSVPGQSCAPARFGSVRPPSPPPPRDAPRIACRASPGGPAGAAGAPRVASSRRARARRPGGGLLLAAREHEAGDGALPGPAPPAHGARRAARQYDAKKHPDTIRPHYDDGVKVVVHAVQRDPRGGGGPRSRALRWRKGWLFVTGGALCVPNAKTGAAEARALVPAPHGGSSARTPRPRRARHAPDGHGAHDFFGSLTMHTRPTSCTTPPRRPPRRRLRRLLSRAGQHPRLAADADDAPRVPRRRHLNGFLGKWVKRPPSGSSKTAGVQEGHRRPWTW